MAMIVRSRYPALSIPDLPLTDFVLGHAAERGEKPALVDGATGRTITYAGLVDGVRRMAGGLAGHGVSQGDVVALFAPNMPEWAIAFYGIASLGGIVTTINSLATGEEIDRQLRDSGARFLITVPPFLDRAAGPARAAGVREVFVFGEADGATPVASLLAEDAQQPRVTISPGDLVALPYSSGTTGFPKGVMLSHRNLVANVLQTGVGQDVREDETLIAILPFFHIYGMSVILNLGLSRGATIVTMPKFELEPFLEAMAQRRVTRAFLVPPIVLALAKHPAVDGYDMSALQLIMSGAAPLDAGLAGACAARLGCVVMQGYGLTETSPVVVITSERPGMARAGSIGTLVPNTEAVIVDVATAEELGPGANGEICFRGPQVMQGYLGNPEATARTIDEAGWLHTGDIGHVDADGYFFIVDRLKELIKYKGYQVPPAELEAILLSHPAVADAAVIPVPDEEAGEIPKAFVVLVDAAFDAEALMPYVAEHVAPYKRIRRVEVIDAIPKSASGKILRRVLVEREREALAVGPGA
jgi:acyl-CoA synthetase (AMP-forming)/AMP-acid ligase II